jgi:hypothetical protein
MVPEEGQVQPFSPGKIGGQTRSLVEAPAQRRTSLTDPKRPSLVELIRFGIPIDLPEVHKIRIDRAQPSHPEHFLIRFDDRQEKTFGMFAELFEQGFSLKGNGFILDLDLLRMSGRTQKETRFPSCSNSTLKDAF